MQSHFRAHIRILRISSTGIEQCCRAGAVNFKVEPELIFFCWPEPRAWLWQHLFGKQKRKALCCDKTWLNPLTPPNQFFDGFFVLSCSTVIILPMSKINFAAKQCISASCNKKQKWFTFIRAHSTTFWTRKSRKLDKNASYCGHALLKKIKCFHS